MIQFGLDMMTMIKNQHPFLFRTSNAREADHRDHRQGAWSSSRANALQLTQIATGEVASLFVNEFGEIHMYFRWAVHVPNGELVPPDMNVRKDVFF